MLRALKFLGFVTLHLMVAFLGTGILATGFGKAFHPHSLDTALWKEWMLSIGCAACIGFFVWRTWRSAAAKWVWVPVAVWFGLMFILALGRGGALWFQFSGSGCANGLRAVECRQFFMFTIPFMRGVSYSLGAYVSSLFQHCSQHAPAQPSTGV